MKVWTGNGYTEMIIGTKVLVAKCGSGRSYHGEFGKLTKITKQHLVFTTDSGAQVKTAVDNIFDVRGKAAKENYWVSPHVEGREDDPNFMKREVYFWDEKKLCLVKK